MVQLVQRGRGARLVTAVLTAAAAWTAQAQDGPEPENLLAQQRLVDDKLKAERLEQAPIQTLLDWQWGGWIDYYYFHFDDGVQSSRQLHRPSGTLWTRLRIDDNAHEIFARMRLTYSYFHEGDQYRRQQDWVGPELDRLFYDVDVGKALRLTRPADPLQLRIRVGRQDVTFGTGYALDLPMDAVVVEGKVFDFKVQGLFGRSIGNYPNIDRSEPVDSHMDRRFFGVQIKYTGIDRHEPFVYALWNDDFTDERPRDWLQNYSYDTQYFGFGSRGQVIERLSYWAECVVESGRSWGDGNFVTRDYVSAWALDAGLEYRFAGPMRKRAAFEYMFASGDGDRIFSPTNAAGGNRWGRKDESFVGFGYRDTGIAAGPALSNINIWKLGGSLTPFEEVELLKDLELGTNWFLYHKHHQRGAISDSTADMFEGFVGWEMDYFINWRLMSDLSWTFRWGIFFPGDAYSDQSSRNFFFTGLTWSF